MTSDRPEVTEPPRTDTKTLAAAMRVLAAEIQSDDGVANAAIAEAAERLDELSGEALDIGSPLNDLKTGILFRSECSGLYYRNHKAAGSISEVVVDGKRFFR